jgi:uncharacterized protein YbcV (DUF1398 family)
MKTSIEKLQTAQRHAIEHRPKVGGFPYLAETLRQAGVKRNIWTLPSCQSVYFMDTGTVVQPGKSLIVDIVDVPLFQEQDLVKAIRDDQSGKSDFFEFLQSIWKAGVLWYEVDFEKRVVTYHGVDEKSYTEAYPEVGV